MTTPFGFQRAVQRSRHHYPAPPAAVFPLLCPVRETDWIAPWRCRMIWSASGVAEENCVFVTDFPEPRGPEVWVVCRYVPARAIEFVRTGPHRVTRLDIHLEPDGAGGTRALWTHTVTALTAEGNAQVANPDVVGYETEMRALERMLVHYLTTGTMLTGEDPGPPGGGGHAHHQPGGPAA